MLQGGDVLKFKKGFGSIRAGMEGVVTGEYRGKWLVKFAFCDSPYMFTINRLRQVCVRLKKK